MFLNVMSIDKGLVTNVIKIDKHVMLLASQINIYLFLLFFESSPEINIEGKA